MASRRLVRAAVVAASVAVSAADAEAWSLMKPRMRPGLYAATSDRGSRRGRPRKFNSPSRAVTVTLPEEVIATLRAIDVDLSLAIVRAIQPLAPRARNLPAELVSYGNRSVVIVPRSRALRERTDVELVPISDGRALICMDERLSIPQLELQLTDALGDPALDDESRELFETLVGILRNARRDHAIELRPRHIIVLHRRNGGSPAQPELTGGVKTTPPRSAG